MNTEYRQTAGGGWQKLVKYVWQHVPAAEVPEEVKTTIRVSAPQLDVDHQDAAEVDYVRARYIRGTNPRRFAVDGATLDAGEFAHHYAARFGREGLSMTTLYIRLNHLLVLGGFRLKAEASRRPSENVGGPRGTGHYPKTL